MRGRVLWRRLPAALVLGLYWITLTASVDAPQVLLPPPQAPPKVIGRHVTPAPVSCVGTLVDLRRNMLRLGDGPKLIILLEITRADRCAGRFGAPVGRLQGVLVLTRDRVVVRSDLRTSQPGYWLNLSRQARPDCVDFEAIIRWPSAPARSR